jgi:peroxiredoxin
MAVTPSTMLALGTSAPDFNLLEPLTQTHKKLADVQGEKGTLIMFICNHCPFVKHIQSGLVSLANDYQDQGIGIAAINSNDVLQYPEDSPPQMQAIAQKLGYSFPYLFDATQQVAKAYDAACTPDFFLFDASLKLVYRGQFDGSRPGNKIPVTGDDLRQALDCLINDQPIPTDQKPSMGCNIKWAS